MRTLLMVGLIAAALGVQSLYAQRGQGLTVRGRRDLRFGTVIAGIPTAVARTDRRLAGRFDIRGRRFAEVVVQFVLPTVLVSGGGATMPILFSANDGGFSRIPSIRAMRGFDPNAPLTTRLGFFRRLYIVLGGTVVPASGQAPGIYRATITITVAYTGN